MTPVSYIVPHEKSSPKVGRAFAAGCKGRVVDVRRGLQDGGFAAFCSPPVWPLLRRAQAEGRDWYYGDHGYFGRGTYFRLTRNAYQHDGRGRGDADRFRRFGIAVQPWQRDGRHIVVCPNSPVYCQLHGFAVDTWITDVRQQLAQVTDREVRVRWKTDSATRPLALDLVRAWAVVVYSSAAALYALAAGVPVVTLAPFAASARMGLADLRRIEQPLRPDGRAPFFGALASNQWTLTEIAAGVAWRSLCHQENSCAA